MTPREAGSIELEEPDWRVRFEEHTKRWPKWPRYLQEDSAFEATLKDYRRFHFSWVEGKQIPMPAAPANIALAKLGLFPPRFTIKDVPRTDATGFQCDDHMWVGPWRIVAIEDRMLLMEKYMEIEGKPETRQIDLAKADWSKYTASAIAVLEARCEYEQRDKSQEAVGSGFIGGSTD
jgi:hypothetical protein